MRLLNKNYQALLEAAASVSDALHLDVDASHLDDDGTFYCIISTLEPLRLPLQDEPTFDGIVFRTTVSLEELEESGLSANALAWDDFALHGPNITQEEFELGLEYTTEEADE